MELQEAYIFAVLEQLSSHGALRQRVGTGEAERGVALCRALNCLQNACASPQVLLFLN